MAAAEFCEWVQVKLYLSLWSEVACAADIAYGNHFFCLYQQKVF